jgi:hypothetical protein
VVEDLSLVNVKFSDFVQDGCHFENNIFMVHTDRLSCVNNGGSGFSTSLTAGTIAPGTSYNYDLTLDRNIGA